MTDSDKAMIAAKGNMFVIIEQGKVFRRKPASPDYAFCGVMSNPTDERKAALLKDLRNANPDRDYPQITGGVRKAHYASYKQAKEIVKNF